MGEKWFFLSVSYFTDSEVAYENIKLFFFAFPHQM